VVRSKFWAAGLGGVFGLEDFAVETVGAGAGVDRGVTGFLGAGIRTTGEKAEKQKAESRNLTEDNGGNGDGNLTTDDTDGHDFWEEF